MTEPTADFFEQFNAESPGIAAELWKRLKEAASNSGRKTVTHACSACGRQDTVTIPVHDLKDIRDGLALISSIEKAQSDIASKRKVDDTSTQARTILKDVAEMSNEEIAEELARLDEELSAE